MASLSSSTSSLFFFMNLFLTLIQQPLLCSAKLHTTTTLFNSHHRITDDDEPVSDPTTYFQVTKPIQTPNTNPCSYLILSHDFANTYTKPPVLARYKPPNDCPSRKFFKVVLEWTAASKGRQFDRIFGVWLGGIELLRSCTAEPRKTGTVWTVKKDVTKYYSLFFNEHTMAVYLGNIIDDTYTGVYHVNVSLHFYPLEEGERGKSSSWADLIKPISRNLPLNDGQWFEVENSTHVVSKEFEIPRNTYRAVLEVYVSFHEKDEFWFGNFVDEYISGNNMTEMPGNGPFREVVITLDDDVTVGAIWPFTVIYTGGVNPFFWRPITGIGSFDLPTYDVEITPFLGKILDGSSHRLGFRVTNALNVWYIDANLHLWLDKKSTQTHGKLLEHSTSPLDLSVRSCFAGFDGSFVAKASRSIVSKGWVESSAHGLIETTSIQRLKYSNAMILGNKANLQVLNQTIHMKSSVCMRTPSSSLVRSGKDSRKFRIDLYSDSADKGDETTEYKADVKLRIDEKSREASESGSVSSGLRNLQSARGYMLVKDRLLSGLGSTEQSYRYHVDDDGDKSCYYRNIRSSNYTILHDKESDVCRRRDHHH